MLKKLALLAVTVGAIVAFAAPALAFASISANAEPEEMFTAKSTNTITSLPAFEIACDSHTIEGELAEDTSEVEEIPATSPSAAVTGSGMADGCTTSIPSLTLMISASVSNLKFTPTSIEATTAETWTFTNPSTSVVGTCQYHGSLSLNYNHNESIVGSVTGENQLEQQTVGTCPFAKGSKVTLSGFFTFTKGTGGGGEALEVTTP